MTSAHSTFSVPAGLPRKDLVRALGDALPLLASSQGETEAALSMPWVGGCAGARGRLTNLDPSGYARTRNFTNGAVSHLSPWIRHGALSLAEVRDAALNKVRDPAEAEKFISELAWRDYWQQVYAVLGERVGEPVEALAQMPRLKPSDAMPRDVLSASTGMACIDDFVRRLHTEGWLHNHERMWLASWLIHVRGVSWRAGADWFLSHLVDGDPASNHLSWQWVAGTFSAKPYIFNRENLERFTSGFHCRRCPVFGACDVEGTYEELSDRLFATASPVRTPATRKIKPSAAWSAGDTPGSGRRPLVWITLDSASGVSPAVTMFPESPRLFVVDPAWLAAERPSLKRLVFLWECLADIPEIEIHLGEPVAVLRSRAAELGCDCLAVAETPCPRIRHAVLMLRETLPVYACAWPAFCDRTRVNDLGRFSRYWQKIRRSAMQPTPR